MNKSTDSYGAIDHLRSVDRFGMCFHLKKFKNEINIIFSENQPLKVRGLLWEFNYNTRNFKKPSSSLRFIRRVKYYQAYDIPHLYVFHVFEPLK